MARLATIHGRPFNPREHVAVASITMFGIASGIIIINMIAKQLQGRLVRTLPRMLSLLAVAVIRIAVASREFAFPVERRSQSDEATTAILDFISLAPLLFALLTTLPVMDLEHGRDGITRSAKSRKTNQTYQPLEVEMTSLDKTGSHVRKVLFSKDGLVNSARAKRMAILTAFLVPTTLFITGTALLLEVNTDDQGYMIGLQVLRPGIFLYLVFFLGILGLAIFYLYSTCTLRIIPDDESMPWYKRWVICGLFVIVRFVWALGCAFTQPAGATGTAVFDMLRGSNVSVWVNLVMVVVMEALVSVVCLLPS